MKEKKKSKYSQIKKQFQRTSSKFFEITPKYSVKDNFNEKNKSVDKAIVIYFIILSSLNHLKIKIITEF